MMRKAFSLFAFACFIWSSGGFAATNRLLYTDTFENYTNGTPLINTNYWYSSSWTDDVGIVFAKVLSNVNLAAASSTNVATIPSEVALSNRYEAVTSINVRLHMQPKIVRYNGPTDMVYDANSVE